MKFPSLWIVSAFAVGIFLGRLTPPSLSLRPLTWISAAAAMLAAGTILLLRRRQWAAWAAVLLAWGALGTAATRLEQVSVPANHVTALLIDGKLDTSEALRWRGRLRLDPVRLPWGLRYDVDLEEVEVAGHALAVTGGLRVSYFRNDKTPEPLPDVRAGDQIEVLVRANSPRNFGNPGAFDFRAHLARQNIHLTGSLRSAELLRKLGSPPATLGHRLARVRATLLERLDRLFASASNQAAVLRAMLLGDAGFIDHEQAEAFQKTSVYHVLVISGLHIAALAAYMLWAGRRLHLSPLATTTLTVIVLVAYVGIVENRPPILRAALMGALYLFARLFFRRVELLNTLGLAALIILAASPSALADPSFQLSFLAVAIIGALAVPWIHHSSEPYRRALEHLSDATRDAAHPPRAMQFRLDARAAAAWLAARVPGRLTSRASWFVAAPCSGALRFWEVCLLSATIQLGMLPLMAHYFHRVSPAGPAANIPAVFLSGLIIPVGLLMLALSLLSSALASLVAKIVGLLVAFLLASVEWFAQWSWTSYRIPEPPLWLLACFFSTLILMAMAARTRRKRWQVALAILLAGVALTVATYPFPPDLGLGNLEVTVLDVGQGDAIFTAFPDGKTMLIDGGGAFGAGRIGKVRSGLDIGEQVVSPYLWHRGLKGIDVLVLTHAHHDHLDGLRAVLENFRVQALWVSRDVSVSSYRSLLELARLHEVPIVRMTRGQAFQWDGVAGDVVWPEPFPEATSPRNDDSLVLRLQHGQIAFLLPGDIEGSVERVLAARGQTLAADFLKVAHHGSRTSTSAEWLHTVAPRVAAISVGERNPFGHPHPDVLARLAANGTRVFRTDRDGAVTLVSDGQKLEVCWFAGASSEQPLRAP